ncbi:hypothetical protein HPT27_01370 [Permianibacter sp. IMCC34836]|uniref:hypothetical protein n=1 Tax=Permianibacter fluminis TaxID=2738515 RepID=UPI001555F02D|nr:hypothetical protein [Permianibacter fluminis]NQD35652.1 hypothetical protein [Permianibacter fluminis]
MGTKVVRLIRNLSVVACVFFTLYAKIGLAAVQCPDGEICERPPTIPSAITYPGSNSTFPATTNAGTYVVNWTAVPAAGYYRLEEQVNGGTWLLIAQPQVNSFTLTNKQNGTYSYRVKSCGDDIDTFGCSLGTRLGGVLTVSLLSVQPAPAAITYPGSNSTFPATSNTGSFVVNWATVSSAGSYWLEEKVGAGAWVKIAQPLSNSYSVSNKPNGDYSYQVKACADAAGTTGCSTAYRTGGVLSVVLPPPAPTVSQTLDKTFSWVLIHGDVPFLVPSYTNAAPGSVALTWSAVAGATSYQYRVWDAQTQTWGTWQTLGNQTYLNYYNESQLSAQFEIRSCGSAGCGNSTAQTVTLSPWRNVGTCNINTGEQQQVCIGGTCVLHQLRYVASCTPTTTCNVQ